MAIFTHRFSELRKYLRISGIKFNWKQAGIRDEVNLPSYGYEK